MQLHTKTQCESAENFNNGAHLSIKAPAARTGPGPHHCNRLVLQPHLPAQRSVRTRWLHHSRSGTGKRASVRLMCFMPVTACGCDAGRQAAGEVREALLPVPRSQQRYRSREAAAASAAARSSMARSTKQRRMGVRTPPRAGCRMPAQQQSCVSPVTSRRPPTARRACASSGLPTSKRRRNRSKWPNPT